MKWLAVCAVLFASVVRAADPLAETIAAYKKPGAKLEAADFAIASVPDADNAADELLAAATLIKDQTAAWRAFDNLDNLTPPLPDSTVYALRKMVGENPAVVSHVDAALRRGGIDWHVKMASPVLETLLPHLNKQRLLANFLMGHAALAHHDGDDTEALRDVRRLVFMSRATDQHGFVVGHLVSISINAIGCTVVERIAPDLKIDDPKAINELVTMLLDDGPQRAGMHDALLSERMSQIDNTRCLVDGKLTVARMLQLGGGNAPPEPLGKITPQLANADLAVLLTHSTTMIDAFDQTSNLPAYRAREPARPAEAGKLTAHPVASLLFANLNRAFEHHYRGATERRLAAVALAVRAYAVAHDGKLPDSLDTLVPEYLPSVPDDPMAQAMPLQCQADPQRPIVYSVGTNGTDDGGSDAAPQGSVGGRWQSDDAVMHLSHGAPAPVVAPTAVK